MNMLQVHNESLSEKYLGMPSDVGSSVNGAFKYLKDRVWKRVQGWLEHTLSTGGKEVLIKAVAQAIPTYSMSCFKLRKGLCEHIDGLLRSFWWGSKEGKRRPCWVAWEDMTKPKQWAAWVLEILGCLIWHSSSDKHGECYKIQVLLVCACSRQFISLMASSWMPQWATHPLGCGVLLLKGKKCLVRDSYGASARERRLISRA